MELQRSRRRPAIGIVLIAIGALTLVCGGGSVLSWVITGILLMFGVVFVAGALRPFRFRIDVDGLTLRVAGLDRLVPWPEIDAIILDEPVPDPGHDTSPFLLLVPAAGSIIDLPLTGTSPLDGRAGLVLLDLDHVRQQTDDIAAALARFGGGRFTDVRRQRRERSASPDFGFGLRGYEPAPVDELIRAAQDALLSDDAALRSEARAELDAARESLPIALRGYDIRQVDTFLGRLSATLAQSPDEDGKPGAG